MLATQLPCWRWSAEIVNSMDRTASCETLAAQLSGIYPEYTQDIPAAASRRCTRSHPPGADGTIIRQAIGLTLVMARGGRQRYLFNLHAFDLFSSSV